MFSKGDKVKYLGGCGYADGDSLHEGDQYIVDEYDEEEHKLYINPRCCPLNPACFKYWKPTNEQRVKQRMEELQHDKSRIY